MVYLDLFSGIGGFALGAWMAGMRFERHYFSEIDPYCVELYQQRFPDAIPLRDIRSIDCEQIIADATSEGLHAGASRGIHCQKKATRTRNVEPERSRPSFIITGGFPCQDISVAGKGAGIGGSRSGLWFEMWRIIRDLRPRFVIIENVGALVSARGIKCLLVEVVGVLFGKTRVGRQIIVRLRPALAAVLEGLAEIGYDAEWQDIRASDVGAPHRRERIWIVAYPNSDLLNRSGESRTRRRVESTDGGGDIPDSDKQHDDNSGFGAGEIRREQASVRRQKSSGVGGASEVRQRPTEPRLGRRTNDVSKWLDGSWEDGIPRLTNRKQYRVDRLRGNGNAIVPYIAAKLFRRI